MFKGSISLPRICARCQRVQGHQVSSRKFATATATAPIASERHGPASHASPGAQHEDKLLREIFDSQHVWKEFSARTNCLNQGRSAGLFRNRYFRTPEGFKQYAEVTLQKCRRIVARIANYNTIAQYKDIVRELDRLSDLLCRVIDPAEFVRSTHPDPQIQNAATEAYALMFEYMNVLNTTPALNRQLLKAISLPEVMSSWSEEERTVASMLAKDFAKSAIDLPDDQRRAFVDISNEVSRLGTEFVDDISAEKPALSIPSSRLKGIDPSMISYFTRFGTTSLPSIGTPATVALRTVHDADTRREIYMANRTSAKSNIERLESLMKRRSELAKLSDFPSFAHMALVDKMAKSPEAVMKFLGALAGENAPRAKQELADLSQFKATHLGLARSDASINAWDRDYYTAQMLASLRSKSRAPDFLSAYFSLGTVMQGLSKLFSRLYGIRLVPRETLPGETWNSDVRRLDVVDEHEGHIAVLYCDLFQRAGKSPNPAHFTLRCSRRISDEERQEAADSPESASIFPNVEEAASDGFSTSYNVRDEGKLYQLPTIALICDFACQQQSYSAKSSRPALLSFHEVETLFHEMGHALHSICGRTVMQNVSGTRCATDFAELPSVLMEHFASAPEVLSLYARHWETDAPLDPSRVKARLDIQRRTHAADVENQVLMSMLDQVYHSANIAGSDQLFDSNKVYHDVWNRYSSIQEPAGTSWQGFFGHLVGYGATYYAYLFDRAIAGKIWHDVFQRRQGGAIDAEAGHLYKEEVLRWGGGRDGWRCVAGVLGDRDGKLAEGGEAAMEMVGQWGLKT